MLQLYQKGKTLNKIFINIASYRDPSLVETIKEAILNAFDSSRLVFGIGLQYYEDEMPDLSFINKSQLKTIIYNVDNRPGLVKIRYEISKLVTDEDYFLMIDSHMIFEKHWDKLIIDEYEELSSILKNKNFIFTGMRVASHLTSEFKYTFMERHFPSFQYQTINSQIWGKTTPINALTCSSIFAPISFLKEVGLDKYSNFLFEEPYLAWRVYMSGWKIYVPEFSNIQQDLNKRSKYIEYAWGNDNTIDRFKSNDSEADRCEIFISMLTNLEGKYSILNPKVNPDLFFNENNTTNNMFDIIKNDIYKINAIINGDKNHPINKKLTDSMIFLSHFIRGYTLY